MSTAWSWYVIVIVASNIIGCVWLLWWTGKRSPGDPAPTQTSHVWDGDITEYNQPMPRWWIVMFYITIVFSVAYLAYYPGMGNYPGAGGWTSAREHAADKSVQDAKVEASLSRFAGKDVGELGEVHEIAEPEHLPHGPDLAALHLAAQDALDRFPPEVCGHKDACTWSARNPAVDLRRMSSVRFRQRRRRGLRQESPF